MGELGKWTGKGVAPGPHGAWTQSSCLSPFYQEKGLVQNNNQSGDTIRYIAGQRGLEMAILRCQNFGKYNHSSNITAHAKLHVIWPERNSSSTNVSNNNIIQIHKIQSPITTFPTLCSPDMWK